MQDFETARELMVQRQLIARGIKDKRVLDAMRSVPRHLFVENSLIDEAYDDTPLPIGEGQTISQPYMVAIMTELLDLRENETVLEIGTGSGYQAAVLSRLCKWVYTVERLAALSKKAQKSISECGYTNVTFLVDDGTIGDPEHAPFDGIIVTAGAPQIPSTLVDQLATGGRIVIPVGDKYSQTLKLVEKTVDGTKMSDHTGCRFVDLIGEFGW
jgi:protein-L-isoaspartate(D-aspartate) O-methyltransferase